MKLYIIPDKTVKEVVSEAGNNLAQDHYVGGVDGSVQVIVNDTDTAYLDGLGLTGEDYIEEEI